MKMIQLCSLMESLLRSKLILLRKLLEDLWILLFRRIRRDKQKSFMNKLRREINLLMDLISQLCSRSLKKDNSALFCLLGVSTRWKNRNFMYSKHTASKKLKNIHCLSIFHNRKTFSGAFITLLLWNITKVSKMNTIFTLWYSSFKEKSCTMLLDKLVY